MLSMKKICSVLLLVGACSALPQYSSQQRPQCTSNQDCVHRYQCVGGYISTDGGIFIRPKFQSKGVTCIDQDICCNIPVSDPEPRFTTCPYNKVCVIPRQCNITGFVITDGSELIGPRGGNSQFQLCLVKHTKEEGICCNPPLPPAPPPLPACRDKKVCVSPGQCDIYGNVITDGRTILNPKGGNSQKCHLQQSKELGICCNPPSPQKPSDTTIIIPADQCGVRNLVPAFDPRIQSNVKNNEAMFGEFPWQGAVFFRNTTFKCAASLISDRLLITAAHCVDGFKPNDIKVRLGEWQVGSTGEPLPYVDVEVADITIHPEFNSDNLHNDISVIQLVKPLAYQYHINSICLPEPRQTFWGQRCIATGWGKDTFERQYQHIMKKVELPTVEHDQCQRQLRETVVGKYFKLDDSLMCAGGVGNKDTCEGDGGGPLACQDPDTGRYVLTGITAFAIGECGTKDVPGVYADVQALLPFVHDVVKGNNIPSSYN